MSKKTTLVQPEPKSISAEELNRAALNEPSGTFQLGDRTFEIADLPYREYLKFVQYLTPFFESLGSMFFSSSQVAIPGINIGSSFNAAKLIELCGDNLPAMVQIICRQTDPTITVEEVERLGKRPSAFIVPIVATIHQNQIIQEFAAFFAQMTKLLAPNQTT